MSRILGWSDQYVDGKPGGTLTINRDHEVKLRVGHWEPYATHLDTGPKFVIVATPTTSSTSQRTFRMSKHT